MSTDSEKPNESPQLRTLRRWRTAELEAAQAERIELERRAHERESERDGVEAKLAQTQSFVREQLAATEPLSPESLRQCAAFAALQRDDLKAAQAAVDESRAQCDTAQEKVMSRFEALSVVQRLSSRRAVEAQRELERAAQSRLDEQALTRLAADRAADIHSQQEE
jgi:hypothetical protein